MQSIKQTTPDPSINISISLDITDIREILDFGKKSIIKTKNGFIIPVNETKESIYDKIQVSKDDYNESFVEEFRNNYENLETT
jgi:hypothetical protein